MLWLYSGFILLILILLALDLGVFNRKAHVIKTKEALAWSAFWISLGMLFTVFIYFGYENHWLGLGLHPDASGQPLDVAGVGVVFNDGGQAALKYVTAFFVEKSLAVDNLFVIALIFTFLGVPPLYQHRVLFWGIIGALVFRGAMIAAGAALLTRFTWVIYIFGGFLIITGLKMLFTSEDEPDVSQSPVLRLLRKFIPVTERYHGEHFFVTVGSKASLEAATPGEEAKPDKSLSMMAHGKRVATPLFLALVLVECTDVIFAVDSIPAVFAITSDPFLVFTSNVFAILGLRSLFFALAGLLDKFHYLKVALAYVLIVVGVKMLAHSWLKNLLGDAFNLVALGVVLGILAIGVVASLVSTRRHGPTPSEPVEPPA